eukprot:gnl/TRDRNA2_/TRDRNA2_192093_c0_seq1.p1 gnl/TRDRNA2_/TRDRNA2_192093_c0~~gnl/TRDRNA2_/TRDRNA2_192093_c0_seq1.p1  ORF type:complete len:159 (+),score=38.96 gnl/TRDRNA2_/TRDRNA2_192093_c0_seq1:55-531(+)
MTQWSLRLPLLLASSSALVVVILVLRRWRDPAQQKLEPGASDKKLSARLESEILRLTKGISVLRGLRAGEERGQKLLTELVARLAEVIVFLREDLKKCNSANSLWRTWRDRPMNMVLDALVPIIEDPDREDMFDKLKKLFRSVTWLLQDELWEPGGKD